RFRAARARAGWSRRFFCAGDASGPQVVGRYSRTGDRTMVRGAGRREGAPMTERIHQRVPFCLRVQFRNASSFLIAYSVNLSRGGVFLESDEVMPVGSEIALQVEVPEAGPVTLTGRVTWRREKPDIDGPVGFGVEFEDMVDVLGSLIDQMVSQFSGITVLLVCPGGRGRVTLTRQLKSIIATAEVVGASDTHVAQTLLDDEIDLIV